MPYTFVNEGKNRSNNPERRYDCSSICREDWNFTFLSFHILSGRNNPSLEVVMKIHKACDYISLDWLLYGEGQMETDVDSDNNIHYTPSLFDENSLFTPDVQFLRNIARKMRLKHHFILLKRLCVRKLSMWKYLPKKSLK